MGVCVRTRLWLEKMRGSARIRCMNKSLYLLFLTVVLLLMPSCRHTLESESGLYDVKLDHSYKVPVKGYWLWGQGNPYAGQKSGKVYISPMDVSMVKGQDAHMLYLLQVQMYSNMVTSIGQSLKEVSRKNHVDWRVTSNPAEADVRIDTALVHFKPQRPGFRVLSAVASVFSSVPGVSNVAAYIGEGDICLETAMRDCRSGQLLAAFKDANRKKARLYTSEAYSATGNADVNLREWAEQLGKLCRVSALDSLGNKTLKEKLENRTLGEAIKARL